jgi:hypothetical protein
LINAWNGSSCHCNVIYLFCLSVMLFWNLFFVFNYSYFLGC